MTIHEKYMQRCLELARNGLGSTYPNPMVGCVIVYNGVVIGEGWHQRAGEPHAEVNAIMSVEDKSLLKKATLYVNLEPCSHHGRTPPCADLIIKEKIKKVVIGAVDIHEKVKGQGILRLEKHGVEVISGILEKECARLNKRFITYHEKKRPYIILKWAQSADAYIFPGDETVKKGAPVWISNMYSRQRVHQWRAEEASILVGKNTVLQDNPKLNTRDFKGFPILRMAIDNNLEIPKEQHLYDGKFETVIFNAKKDLDESMVKFVQLDFSINIIDQIIDHLYQNNIQSLIVEGGAITLNEFLKEGLWDEARVFCGDIKLGGGIKAPKLHATVDKEESILKDRLIWYKNSL